MQADVFPAEFDPDFMRSQNADLREMTDAQLRAHFEEYGCEEGRAASVAALRADFLALIPEDWSVLEIGPFSNPALRGRNVTYTDIMTTEEIRRETSNRGADPATVPEIEFPTGLNGVDRTFDCLLSCHNIEHHPDLIGHLQRADALLEQDGVYCLIVPDKRFIFDHSFAETNPAEVIEAHLQPHPNHTLRHMLEHYGLTTHNDGGEHWAGRHGTATPAELAARLKHAMTVYAAQPGHYFDVHAWKFTPKSFRHLLEVLHALELIAFKPVRIYETPEGMIEFCAVLQKTAVGEATN